MKNNSGFTLIELIIVMVILLTLFGFVTINLVSIQQKTTVVSAVDTLVSDMATQQTKAMVGAGNSSGNSYGIYFGTDKYILFKGNTYNPSDSSNYTVNLDNGYTIIDSFPGNTLIFSAITGEVKNFTNGQSSVDVEDSQGKITKTVVVNRYGVVVSEN